MVRYIWYMVYGTVGDVVGVVVGAIVDFGDQNLCLPASLPSWRREGDFVVEERGGEGKSEVRSRKSNVSSSRQNGFVRIEYLIHIVQRGREEQEKKKKKRDR